MAKCLSPACLLRVIKIKFYLMLNFGLSQEDIFKISYTFKRAINLFIKSLPFSN